ncbi:TIR domain-containing protein [Salinarimonas sp.]|uniref:TIR domain-containing protein n=1 Tax=Salinarimonas sp. TaxID=2766526 RepID=UPI003919B3DD
MPYRNKTYICFDGDTDMAYYRLMTAWKANDGLSFNFHNAHDLNTARDSSLEESIKRQLRVRFANSKTFVVLIGEKTRYLRKFVKWEMETALRLGLPIIGVNLNGSRSIEGLCPPAIRHSLSVYVSFNMRIIAHALDEWPPEHRHLTSAGKSGPYYYTTEVYKRLGL